MLFGKKLTAEEIEQRKKDIYAMVDNGKTSGVVPAALQLNKEAKKEGSKILGQAYYIGTWGVVPDNEKALQYALEYADIHPEDALNWRIAGNAAIRIPDYVKGLECYQEALSHGSIDSLGACGYTSYLEGYKVDHMVGLHNLNIATTVSQTKTVCQYYYNAIQYFTAYMAQEKIDMPVFYWGAFARSACFLYNYAMRGVVGLNDVQDGGLKKQILGWAGTSVNALFNTMDSGTRDALFELVVQTAEFMRRKNQPCFAEYTLAYASILESEARKSAEAFYRARWHLKKVGEYRETMDPAAASQIEQEFDLSSFEKLDGKYGEAVHNMVAAGQLPAIEKDYPEGSAPDPQECRNFMEWFESEKSREYVSQNTSGFLKGLFGRR